MRNDCNIIKDLIPMYIEKMTSPDTNFFIEEHLSHCDSCRKEFEEQIKPEAYSAVPDITYKNDPSPIKALKRKWSFMKICIAAVSSIISTVLVLAIVAYLFVLNQHPFLVASPANSEDIQIATRIGYCETGYLDQQFVIEFEHLKGKALQISREDNKVYDGNGHYTITGYTLTVKETVIDVFGASDYQSIISTAYTYSEDVLPSDFDFMITVVFEDQTLEYSMVAEGLFTDQDTGN